MNKLWRLAPIALISACGSISGVFDDPPPTLADLQPVELPADTQAPPKVSLGELAQIYRDVLAQQQDPQTRLQVSHRLADIEMLDAEEQLASTDTDDAFFAGAISAYENLLADNPDYPLQDQVLYQLSKAYSLSGQSDASQAVLEKLSAAAPDSPHLPEAYFRQAERQFVEASYAPAEAMYARVIEYGMQTPYYTRALYMQGWSRFKQDKNHEAIEAFSASLDQLLTEDIAVDTLPRAEQELVQDSLRVLAIVFSKLNGVDAIASAYATLGARPYEYLLYEALGKLYLSQERYDDSAMTYQAFIEHYPDSRRAHRFQMRVIEAYEAGGFKDLIVAAKQDYVAAFSVDGEYWLDSDEAAQQAMAGQLQVFIPELASHHHALAQAAAKKDSDTAQDEYLAAAHYYQLFIDSFPNDHEVPRLAFLLAESLYEAGDYFAAIATYEWVAYIQGDPDSAADAAYTAILAYAKLSEQYLDNNEVENANTLQPNRINAELRFQQSFPTDARANSVLGHAATALLELQDYSAALSAASKLLGLTPQPETALLTPAWLVAGHSLFALEDFAEAEHAYQQTLALLPANDERVATTTERLAASIYRQGEQATELGDDAIAALHFQRATDTAPTSEIGINAQFDAAQALIRAGELQQANALLTDFRHRHPAHALTASIGATLLQNYEQLEQWRNAALEVDTLHAAALTATTDEDLARQTLIVAARYYDKADDQATAIARYRSYAHDWPEPLNENLEAMHRLNELYADAGEVQKQHFWLRKTMTAHDAAGAQQTDRSRFLAANAASVIADTAFTVFSALRLTLPIKKTLPKKKRAMEQALADYNRCNNYAVEQFITLCTYRLGRVYQQLSADLMDSERPKGLDTLALEQYDIMLEEQAFPFEEKAIAIHESNALRSRKGLYDEWVRHSFASLGDLLPARYGKRETVAASQVAELQGAPYKPSRKVTELNLDGIALRELGDFNAAEEAYLAALDRAEDDALTHRNIGILYDLYLGIPGKAIYHYDRYQSLTGDSDRKVAGWIIDLERRHVSLARESL